MEEPLIKITEKINLKKILIGFGIVIAMIVIYSVVMIVVRIGKVPVKIQYAPFAATVVLGENEMRNNAENYVTPGVYDLRVEFENFEAIEKEIEITEDTVFLVGALLAINDEGERYVSEHQDEFVVVKDYADGVNGSDMERLIETYPLLGDLPYTDPYYILDYTLTEESRPVITISVGLGHRAIAINKLISMWGENGAEIYDVKILDLENPYEGKFVENNERDPKKFLEVGFASAGLDFEVGGGTEDGDYYYAYLRYYFQTYIGVIYRVVLRRSDSGWRLVADPYPVLTAVNTPDIPLDILNKVNGL